jgi:class I fructose-bisphosphate aldolase
MVLHKGMMRFLEPVSHPLPGIFMHLSASTQLGEDFHFKVLVGTVEEALRRGADGVSVHINLGGSHEYDMLHDLGTVGESCAAWQVPMLVMIYVRGEKIPSPVPDTAIAHAARVAAELGADIIKIPAPADYDVLAQITESLPVPVVVAGGNKARETLLFLEHLEKVLQAGARGVAIGRNVFQHDQPDALLAAICNMVHHGFSAARAWEGFSQERQS